jgi:insertion element IS1 protein InsB
MECKHCKSEQVVKDGKNGSGSQRYLCRTCARHFTPQPNPIGYDDAMKQTAVKDYLDDGNFRRIGRQLKVNHQTVVNWVNQAASTLLPDDAPRPVIDDDAVVELDELFTFIGDKKTKPTLSPKFTGKPGVS